MSQNEQITDRKMSQICPILVPIWQLRGSIVSSRISNNYYRTRILTIAYSWNLLMFSLIVRVQVASYLRDSLVRSAVVLSCHTTSCDFNIVSLRDDDCIFASRLHVGILLAWSEMYFSSACIVYSSGLAGMLTASIL